MNKGPAPGRARRIAVVAGAVAQRPWIAGHAWVFLNWLSGLRSLGYEVVFVDRLEPDMQTDPGVPAECSVEWRWLQSVMQATDLGHEVALLVDDGARSLGMERPALLERCRRADVLFNFMGYLDDAEIGEAVDGPLVFVDLDPGFPQMWHELGLCDPFEGHDAFVTVGLAVGESGSTVPTCGRKWLRTPPPVDLARWPERDPCESGPVPVVSEVATWRGRNGPVEYRGTEYGLRVHEFRRYATLPEERPELAFRMALDIDPGDASDASLLEGGGWRIDDPLARVAELADYQRYLADSDLEFCVAKQMYVRSRGGWFSDRSACYLASGRPVVAQETGFSEYLPAGEGLLSFSDRSGAERALREVAADLPRHRKAARAIAAEHLDAATVLRRVTAEVGVG